jgi:membrane associated rhomboid family serine protease
MPRCVDCGTETPREEMYGPPDELRCRACVQRRFPTTNVPTRHRSTTFLRWPPVTSSAVAVSIIVTLLFWSQLPQIRWLIADPEPIWEGELWRLFTSVFVHSNVIHLAFDVWFIWLFGKATEQWMGSLRFAGFFIATAIGPLAAEVLADGSGIGLSGVGYALFGFLYALRRDEEFAAQLMTPNVVTTLVGWFFLCIILTYLKIMPVANVAHGAGAAIGWLFGQAVLSRRPVMGVTVIGVLCVGLALATLYMPWNGRYDFHRGEVCLDQKDYAGAVRWFELAATRLSGPNQDAARHNAGVAKYRMEHGEQDED